jgi:hypothetical protein
MLGTVMSAMSNAQVVATSDGSGVARFTMNAGQTINAGALSVRVNQKNVEVTYATTNGWTLSEAHLWVGASIVDLPQTKSGNPQPGQFPHKATLNGATSYTFSIPLSNAAINFSCPGKDAIYLLSAHAAIQKRNADGTIQQETAWSAGSRITTKGNWATFSTFTLTCPAPAAVSTGAATCETAFARDAAKNISFLDYGFERWGWSNGPYSVGRYVMDLWAGAGQSDVTKGYLAGTVTVDYNGSFASVTYRMNSGWWLNETHAYAGATMFPQVKQGQKIVDTVSPGQFPLKHSLDHATSDTFTTAVSGSIYTIAHAVACRAQ